MQKSPTEQGQGAAGTDKEQLAAAYERRLDTLDNEWKQLKSRLDERKDQIDVDVAKKEFDQSMTNAKEELRQLRAAGAERVDMMKANVENAIRSVEANLRELRTQLEELPSREAPPS